MSNEDVRFKTSFEVSKIRRSCNIIELTFHELEFFITTGISTYEITEFCDDFIGSKGTTPLSLEYSKDSLSICTSVNSVAVHGLPTNYVLETGDIITVDIIVSTEGWYGDGAFTYIVGDCDTETMSLYRVAKEATYAGIRAAKVGNRFGDIGFAISNIASRWGCSVIESLAGHGIGLVIHEDPVVLPVGEPHTGLPVLPGMVFTIEPVLTFGSGEIRTLKDGESIITADGRHTAQFEHTIAIFAKRTEVLTKPELSFYL